MARPKKYKRHKRRTEFRKTTYPPEFRVACLLHVKASDNVAKTARDMEVPIQTLRNWMRGDRAKYAMAFRDVFAGDMEQAFRHTIWHALGLAAAKADGATYPQLLTGVGIAFDKLQLLTGGPTANTTATAVNVNVTAGLEKLSAGERAVLAAIMRKMRGDDNGSSDDTGPDRDTPGTGENRLPPIPGGSVPDPGTEPADPL